MAINKFIPCKPVILCLLWVVLFNFPSPVDGKPLDMIAATVGDEVITVGEVITESRLMTVLAAADASVSLPVPGAFKKDVLDMMINRMLVSREAAKFREEEKDTASLDELLAFEKKFAYAGEVSLFLKQEGLTAGELAKRFAVERQVSFFISEKIAVSVHVTAEEIEAFFSQNEAYFQGESLWDVKNEVKEILVKRKSGQFLDKWLSDLRGRGKIRYFRVTPFEEPE